ncbi:MAG: hypothetical protein V1911_04195 [Candidatus Micrarchaeota archaeon]
MKEVEPVRALESKILDPKTCGEEEKTDIKRVQRYLEQGALDNAEGTLAKITYFEMQALGIETTPANQKAVRRIIENKIKNWMNAEKGQQAKQTSEEQRERERIFAEVKKTEEEVNRRIEDIRKKGEQDRKELKAAARQKAAEMARDRDTLLEAAEKFEKMGNKDIAESNRAVAADLDKRIKKLS